MWLSAEVSCVFRISRAARCWEAGSHEGARLAALRPYTCRLLSYAQRAPQPADAPPTILPNRMAGTPSMPNRDEGGFGKMTMV